MGLRHFSSGFTFQKLSPSFFISHYVLKQSTKSKGNASEVLNLKDNTYLKKELHLSTTAALSPL